MDGDIQTDGNKQTDGTNGQIKQIDGQNNKWTEKNEKKKTIPRRKLTLISCDIY